MAQDRHAGPALYLLSCRSGSSAPVKGAATEAETDNLRVSKPALSRHARRVAIPSLSLAAAPLVHWTPSAARPGDAFRWAGSMLTLCERGDPFVLLLHGGLRRADMATARTPVADEAGDRLLNSDTLSALATVTESADGVADPRAAMWRPYAAWLGKHRRDWQTVCRGVIVIAPDIVTRVDTRNDAQALFGEGTRVVAVSQETLAHQLARVLIAERQTARSNARGDAVARGSM